jgi:NADH-quinone oxidoreductase subunit J
MFTEYVYPFELASVILLVGIVAAVALTQRGKRKNKAVNPSQQVFVKAGDRVRVLQMPAEKRD